MGNISQFYGKDFPIGTVLSLPYNGNYYNPGDGTEWYALVQTSPKAYTSDYSHLSDVWTSPHPIMTGPEPSGLYNVKTFTAGGNLSIAYRPSPTLYVTPAYGYEISNSSFFYYTSTDGSTWTKRYFPSTGSSSAYSSYSIIQYTAGKFVAVAFGTTTNGVVTSTDGINWTPATIPSFSNIADIISDGGNNFFMAQYSGTLGAYSSDAGATWSSVTTPLNISTLAIGQPGLGLIAWCAAAGLFILGSSTNGSYMTSPTGQVWTARSSQISFNFGISNNSLLTNCRFASNGTIFVVAGTGGFFATSTDGLNWTNHGHMINGLGTNTAIFLYYDGTRFVARYLNRVFYSTDGTSWTEGSKVPPPSVQCQSSGVYFGSIGTPYAGGSTLYKITDITLTTRQTLAPHLTHNTISSTNSYIRIK